MKKLILLLALAFVVCGCNKPTNNIEAPVGSNPFTSTFQTIIIDSCEYIIGSYKLAHKGNCKFCAERRRKEQEELINKIKEQ